jgi:transposase
MAAMEDRLIMSKNELERKTLLEGFKNGKLTLNECAERLKISYRQMKRVLKKYREESDQGLCHKNRGRKPSNIAKPELKAEILDLYRRKYVGFGPTFAAEKMLEDDEKKVNAETLRLWLKAEGLWVRKRKHVVYRERRERRPRFGDLVQIDGSIHDWFSNDEHHCLLNMVDDATGITFALLDTGETTKILLTCLNAWIEKYGIPKAVYVDLKSVYVAPTRLKYRYDDDLITKEGFSVFEQVCKRLGIDIIKAYSAQAKGRVERKHAVFQDRLVKEIKLYKMTTLEEANKHLLAKFLPKINQKFYYLPKENVDAHRDPKPYGDLNEIVCWTYKRKLKNNWSVQLNRRYYQIKQPNVSIHLKPGDLLTLKKHLNDSMSCWYNDNRIDFYVLETKPAPFSHQEEYLSRGKKRWDGGDLYLRGLIGPGKPLMLLDSNT